jgi:hypothetical protein
VYLGLKSPQGLGPPKFRVVVVPPGKSRHRRAAFCATWPRLHLGGTSPRWLSGEAGGCSERVELPLQDGDANDSEMERGLRVVAPGDAGDGTGGVGPGQEGDDRLEGVDEEAGGVLAGRAYQMLFGGAGSRQRAVGCRLFGFQQRPATADCVERADASTMAPMSSKTGLTKAGAWIAGAHRSSVPKAAGNKTPFDACRTDRPRSPRRLP